ncbi:MAG TPA: TrkA family potassium uptake protein [Symbiobacteriaceae bacterium]|nr:TrkA family potassium uptake protein [Symbiobacteriaceae bacterium]
MQKRYAVIGLGRFGSSVAKVLTDMGQYVLAVDYDEETVDAMGARLPRVVRADSKDPAALKALRIAEYDTVVVAIGDDVEASVITCLNCRDLGVKNIVAKAQDEAHGRVLERLGVDRTVYPQRDMGARVAHNISAGGIIDFIRLSEQYGMAEVVAPEALVGQTLGEADMRNSYGLNVMAIKRGNRLIVSPGAAEKVAAQDVLVVIGEAGGIQRLQGD